MIENLDMVIKIAEQAGRKILSIYQQGGVDVERKSDKSPITIADREAHDIICEGLANLEPSYPILSEESAEKAFDERQSWQKYWLVDPLDGTKEFINRTDEFTVNIALIEGNRPTFGLVYLPVTQEVFYGAQTVGAFHRRSPSEPFREITVEAQQQRARCLVSRSHADSEQEKILAVWPDAEIVPAGSSLKFCRIAEGAADIYFRRGPTMEWDTAAGQCILESAGGVMYKLDGAEFNYHKDQLLNPGFVALSRKDWAWKKLL